MKNIFEPWPETKFSKNMVTIISLGFLLLSLFMYLTVNLQKEFFFYMGVVSLAVLAASRLQFFQIPFFNDKKSTYVFSLVGLGIGTMLGLATGKFSMILPTQALYLGDLSFIFANIIAPLIEPLFFRCVVFFSIFAISKQFLGTKKAFMAGIIAMFAASFLFGFYHVNVYYAQAGGDFLSTLDIILFAALFGAFFQIGSLLSKTVAFEIGWHFANNLFSQGYAAANIFPTLIAGFVVWAIIIEAADRMR